MWSHPRLQLAWDLFRGEVLKPGGLREVLKESDRADFPREPP